MKKQIFKIPGIIILIIVIIVCLVFLNIHNSDDENTLYTKKYDNIVLRVKRYDYTVGQNQLVGVEKSTNKGKNFERVTKDPVPISMEPKFIFLNQKVGFIISKTDLSRTNGFAGIKVTKNGGISFKDAKIHYDNYDIEVLTVKKGPYIENGKLKLKCIIYQIKKDKSEYGKVNLIFVSKDSGLNWNLSK